MSYSGDTFRYGTCRTNAPKSSIGAAFPRDLSLYSDKHSHFVKSDGSHWSRYTEGIDTVDFYRQRKDRNWKDTESQPHSQVLLPMKTTDKKFEVSLSGSSYQTGSTKSIDQLEPSDACSSADSTPIRRSRFLKPNTGQELDKKPPEADKNPVEACEGKLAYLQRILSRNKPKPTDMKTEIQEKTYKPEPQSLSRSDSGIDDNFPIEAIDIDYPSITDSDLSDICNRMGDLSLESNEAAETKNFSSTETNLTSQSNTDQIENQENQVCIVRAELEPIITMSENKIEMEERDRDGKVCHKSDSADYEELSDCADVKSTSTNHKKHRTKRNKHKSERLKNRSTKTDCDGKNVFTTHDEENDVNRLTVQGPIYFCPLTSKIYHKPKALRKPKKPCIMPNGLKRYMPFLTKFVGKSKSPESVDSGVYFNEVDGKFVHQSASEASDDEFTIVFADTNESDDKRIKQDSECESEDSFVICFQSDCDVGDRYTDDIETETSDGEDSDDDTCKGGESDDDTCKDSISTEEETIAEVNLLKSCLRKSRSRGSSPKSTKKKQVSFTSKPPEIHRIIAWSYAYRQARIGNWQNFSRDAERFKNRIMEVSVSLEWVLKREHRARVYFQRFRPILMRQIREEKEAKRKEAERIKKEEEEKLKLKIEEEERMKEDEIVSTVPTVNESITAS